MSPFCHILYMKYDHQFAKTVTQGTQGKGLYFFLDFRDFFKLFFFVLGRAGLGGLDWLGLAWLGLAWLGWDGTDRTGTGRDRMECDGTGRDVTGCDAQPDPTLNRHVKAK